MTSQDANPDRNANNPQSNAFQELIAGYVLGDLSSDEMAEVQQYLASNPQARTEVAELQATLNLLPLSLPEDVAPRRALNTKLLEAAAETPQRAQKNEAVPAPVVGFQSRQQWHAPVTGGAITKTVCFAIAATIAAAVLGFQNLQLRNQLQFAQQQSEERLVAIETQLASAKSDVAEYQEVISILRLPENRLLSLSAASGFTETSSGSVVIAPQRSWAMLALKDLPDPPAGKAYQLWAVVNGEKIYCVEFKPDETGQVLVEIPVGNWAGTPMVSITLEDEGTIPTQTSEMVMNGAVI